MRLLLALILSLALGQPLAAQTTLRVVGAPQPLAGGAETAFMRPLWSPDGARLAFTSPGYDGLWVTTPDGGSPVQVTDEPGAGFGFSWSSDGTTLLARVARVEGTRRLDAVKVFDLASGEARRLTDYRARMPALPRWGPTDARVYLYHGGALEVLDSGKAPAGAAKTTPDAPVFFAREQGIGRARLTDGAVATLAAFDEAQVLNLAPSPDGTRLVFEVLGGNLYVLEADGTGLVDLGPGHRPQWSPDGRWVVYMQTEDDGYRFTASDLYAARADGSLHVRLTDTADRLEMNPSWAPDGRRIAFDELQSGALYVLQVAEE